MEQAILYMEEQRGLLGDGVVNTTIDALKVQLAEMAAIAPTSVSAQQVVTVLVALGEPAAPWDALLPRVSNQSGQVVQQSNQTLVLVFASAASPQERAEQAIWTALTLATPTTDAAPTLQFGVHTGLIRVADEAPIHLQVGSLSPIMDIARQLAQQADAGQVFISGRAYHRVRGVFDVIEQTPNMEDSSAPIYRVEKAKRRPYRIDTHHIAGVETPMIGREAELEYLQKTFEAVVESRQLRFTLVLGTTGVGKTRLVNEFMQWVEVLRQAFWYLPGRATLEMSDVPYALFRQLINLRFDIHDHDPPEEACDKLVNGIRELAGQDLTEQAHIIGHLLGFDFTNSPYLLGMRGDVEQTREIAFEAMAVFLRQMVAASGFPILIMVEDLHCADLGTLDLLTYLTTHANDVPLMILAATRPGLFDRYPAWEADVDGIEIIELHALSTVQSRTLVQAILQYVSPESDTLVDLIAERGDGNPYHLEELTRLLIDEGAIMPDVDAWRLDMERLDTVQLPNTLGGVIQARLYGLPAVERVTLQRAAIIGRVFWDVAVDHLNQSAHDPPIDTQAALQHLVERDLIVAADNSMLPAAHQYYFRQELLHSVAYNSLRQQVRRRYHIRLAQWLIGQGVARTGEFAGLIAANFSRAGEARRAVKWYGLAAQQAQQAHLPEQAIRYFEQALMILPDNSDDLQLQSTLYEGFGQVLDTQARYLDAVSAYTAVCIAAEKAGDMEKQVVGWCALVDLHINLDDAHEALFCAWQALEIAESMPPDRQAMALVAAWIGVGTAHNSLGQAVEGLPWLEQALTGSREMGLIRYIALALNQLGNAERQCNQYEVALQHYEEALEIIRQIDERRLEGQLLNHLAETTRCLGDLRATVGYLQTAVVVARQTSARSDLIVYLSNLGGALVQTGYHQDATRYLRQVLALMGNEGWWGVVGTYAYLAEAFLGTGNIEAALEAAQHALQWARRHDLPLDLGIAWRVMGQVAAKLMGFASPSADDCFDYSHEALTKGQHHFELAQTLRAWAQHAHSRGKVKMAQQRWQTARDLFRQIGAHRLADSMGELT